MIAAWKFPDTAIQHAQCCKDHFRIDELKYIPVLFNFLLT
uniref:Uncharacterized protein n=1 Tax=Arundo donax TaxID=35708 RepID=A0A0A8ZAT9_ARUDO